MRVRISIYAFLLPLYFLMCYPASGQRTTRNNYIGTYENRLSWDPIWFFPSGNITNFKCTINGNITRNGNITVNGSKGELIVNDTLIIYGNLYLGDENKLDIKNNAVLIVFGNLHLDDEAEVKADGYFIVTGNIILEDDDDGRFTSNDDPVKVFIGGSIPSKLTNNHSRYPVLNCSNPPTIPYPNSTCSYGNILDLLEDPIYSFYNTLCPSPLPAIITANGATSFCEGGNVTLTANTGIAYLWSNGAESKSIEVLSSGSFTVWTTNSIGCQSAESNPEDVVVHPTPPKPIITASGPLSFCEGESVTLTAQEASSYSWSNGATSRSITVINQGFFRVNVTNEFGCVSEESNAISTTVSPTPPRPVITFSEPTSFCEGDSIKLSVNSGTSWFWSTGAVTKDIFVSANGVYTVRVSNALGCISLASAPVETHVNPLPSKPTIVADGSSSFCDGGTVKLTSTSATSYEWSNGLKTRSINVTKNGLYSVKVTDKNGCTSILSDPHQVVVNPNPVAVITANGPLSFCEGEKRTLTAGGGNSYLWSNGLTGKSIEVSQGGLYSVRVTNQWGCSNQTEAEIVVWQNPSSFAGPDQALNSVFATVLNAELSTGETGEWKVITGGSHIDDINSPSSQVDRLSIGQNKFLWKVSDGRCYGESVVIVYVKDMSIPNVITPNNDGKNDYFDVGNIPPNTELIIVDRLGKLRFSDANYSNNWEGVSNEGVTLNEGTYFYVLKFSNGITKKGYILIKR